LISRESTDIFCDMKKLPGFFITLPLWLAAAGAALAAPNLSADINADIRAATAAEAKREATDYAVRTGVTAVLSRYSDRLIIDHLLDGMDAAALHNLVAATSISNEKLSKTAYAARFSITLDRGAVEKWFAANNVPNYISASDESKDRMIIIAVFPNGIGDWAELSRLARESGEKYDLSIRTMYRNRATAYILTNKSRKFQSLAAANGWTVGNRDGIIQISK